MSEQEFVPLDASASLRSYLVQKEITVGEMLKQLKIADRFFAVLVNGKKESLDHKLSEKDTVLILPKIAGG